MDHNDYSRKLQQLEDWNRSNLIDLGIWARNDALPWLWKELSGAILVPKQKHPNALRAPKPALLTPLTDPEAVRKGLMVSISDRENKLAEPSYYSAQLTMLHKEATRYCESIDRFAQASSVFAEDAVVHTLHRPLHEMMQYALTLLEDAGHNVAGVSGYFGAWRRKHDAAFEVYKGAEQSIYGTYSSMTHADLAPYTPVAVLRTAIELRLRGAFCISSFSHAQKPDQLIPIDLSRLFDSIQQHQKEVHFLVDMHDVWKIYRWSNFYLHAGVRDFPWVVGFLLQYLRPLFSGPEFTDHSTYSIHGGISMRRETWHAVRNSLLPDDDRPSLFERLSNALGTLKPPKKSPLQLTPASENEADCVFLN